MVGSGSAGKSSCLSPLLLPLGRGPPTACEEVEDIVRDIIPDPIRLLLLPLLALVLLLLLLSSGAGDELSIRENKLACAT